ncbi:MBL fold metallo-hydrolase [Nocardia salmonicida]|uniref:MBL fold metallo-hydrolase n=1 Tax=Nocardia salmonicida TaxID=53431 RepID=UPI003CE9F491
MVDPGGLTDPRALDGVDAVLVTHEHFDHFSEAVVFTDRAAWGESCGVEVDVGLTHPQRLPETPPGRRDEQHPVGKVIGVAILGDGGHPMFPRRLEHAGVERWYGTAEVFHADQEPLYGGGIHEHRTRQTSSPNPGL